jgi:hypothetical protein
MNPNANAISLLEQNLDKIYSCRIYRTSCQYWLSQNPNAIHLLEQNPEKIVWSQLSKNPKAIHLLEQNQDKLDWLNLCLNPNIFEPDYQAMSIDRTKIIYQELMEKALHPSRILQWIELDIDFDF